MLLRADSGFADVSKSLNSRSCKKDLLAQACCLSAEVLSACLDWKAIEMPYSKGTKRLSGPSTVVQKS